jgi:hypothetical protein
VKRAFSIIAVLAFFSTGVAVAETHVPGMIAVTVVNHTKTGAWITLYGNTPMTMWKIERAECVQPGTSRVMVAHAAGVKVRAEPMEGYECKGRRLSDVSVQRDNYQVPVENGRIDVTTTLTGGDGRSYQLTSL